MAGKSREQPRFGRKIDGIDRSDSNFHFKKVSTPLSFENKVFKKKMRDPRFEYSSLGLRTVRVGFKKTTPLGESFEIS